VASVDVEFCPYFQDAVELIGRRWCGPIARSLLAGPLRFSELERTLPGISARLLTQRLRELEAEGVVARTVETEGPVRVSYELTAKGRALDEAVEAIESWAHDWLAPPAHAHA
jgi:DNA-binding HxlR family transcriptional regulator